MEGSAIDLPRLFEAANARLVLEQAALNGADPINHDHGDHMVEIFQVAAQAAAAKSSGTGASSAALAEAMEYAAELLRRHPENGSAQVYANGLAQLAGQFRQRGIGLEDLLPYVQQMLQKQETGTEPSEASAAKSAEVLKALLNALAGWEKAESGGAENGGASRDSAAGGLDLGYLFGVGMSYMQARQKGGDALEILAETVVSASPLTRVPHRHQSGKIALRALLEAMGTSPV